MPGGPGRMNNWRANSACQAPCVTARMGRVWAGSAPAKQVSHKKLAVRKKRHHFREQTVEMLFGHWLVHRLQLTVLSGAASRTMNFVAFDRLFEELRGSEAPTGDLEV